MSYFDIFKNKTWTTDSGFEELVQGQDPLESAELFKILNDFLILAVSESQDKELQEEMLSILPKLYNLLSICQKIFLATYLENQRSPKTETLK